MEIDRAQIEEEIKALANLDQTITPIVQLIGEVIQENGDAHNLLAAVIANLKSMSIAITNRRAFWDDFLNPPPKG